MPKLSILICSLNSRIKMRKQMLLILVDSLGEHTHEETSHKDYTIGKYFNDEVEVIICTDDKQLKVGDKRNLLVSLATGQYVTQVDDDDRLENYYINELLEATKSNADVITFYVSVSINGMTAKLCYYSKEYKSDHNDSNYYYRLPNHLMCVKRELASSVPFMPLNFGEDADYAKRLKPLLKTELSINKVLYHYDYNFKTSQTQNR